MTAAVHTIPHGAVELEGELIVPDSASGIVIFAHGSGSSRHSPRNNFVAEHLRDQQLGTLLFDLLTETEDRDRSNRFDIDLLTTRLNRTTKWVCDRPEFQGQPLCYFGASTGAAAAIRAGATRDDIAAVVARGGRVDLAAERFDDITAPTLLVVGSEDQPVLKYNRQAQNNLACETELHIVEGAGHLFEGPGELDDVATIAAEWFCKHCVQ